MHRSRLPPYTRSAAIVIILLGLTFRISQYAAGRSLWLDEAMLAQNIALRSGWQLALPLRSSLSLQVAPLGFLFVEKGVLGAAAAAPNDHAALASRDYLLRLFPLVAGCLSLFLMNRLSGDCLAGSSAVLALALFAFSTHQIYYASELKQYSTDVALALLVSLVTARLFEKELSTAAGLWLAVLGSIAVWFSQPIVFVLAGAGLALIADHITRRDRRTMQRLLWVYASWALSFAILYVVTLRHIIGDPRLVDYWRDAFMPMPPWSNLRWFVDTLKAALRNPFDISPYPLGIALLVIGSASWSWRAPRWAVLLLSPGLLALLASGFKLYPFGERLILFLAPSVLLLIAEGLERVRWLLRGQPRLAIGVWSLFAACLLYQPVVSAVKHVADPRVREELRPVMEYVRQQKQSGDWINVYRPAEPAFSFYAPLYGFERRDYSVGLNPQTHPDIFRGRQRAWVVLSHIRHDQSDDEAVLLAYLDSLGTQLDRIKRHGAAAYLYGVGQAR